MSWKRWDIPLFIVTLLLVGLGLTMVYSSSAVFSESRFGDGFYFFKKSFLFSGFGFGALFLAYRIPYEKWRKAVYPVLLGTCLLMILVLFSGLGLSGGGAVRWLHLGPLRFQPSELAKLAMVLFMAYSMAKKLDRMKVFLVGVFPHLIIGMFIIGLILLQKDLGSAVIIGGVVWMMMFIGGARVTHLTALLLATLPLGYYLILKEGYRLQRILSFLDPWKDRYGSGFQVIQSYLAFNEGGFLGKGLGSGQQKLFYLPEAHTDFIFAVIGEELGFIGVLFVVALFVFFCYRGFLVAVRTQDLFGRYLAFGITTLIGLQALCNMAVVTGLLPTKGLVLPFISYGGSSLVITMFSVGILLNISRYESGYRMWGNGGAPVSRDRTGRDVRGNTARA